VFSVCLACVSVGIDCRTAVDVNAHQERRDWRADGISFLSIKKRENSNCVEIFRRYSKTGICWARMEGTVHLVRVIVLFSFGA